jgi:DNA-binding PadR family transcriptional regulator
MHHHYHFVGRHRGHHPFGHFGRGFMEGGGMGGRGFGMGRKLSSGDLQLLILKLLDEKSRYGYEIIKDLDERSKGFYVPSPGMVYPALTYLEEIGHATVEAEGAKKLYRITEAGREYLEKNRAVADSMLSELVRISDKMTHIRRFFSGARGEHAADDETGEAERGSEALYAARRELKAALHAKRRCSREEADRIAEILRRAAAEIAKD